MSFLRGFSIAMGANIIVFALSFLNNKLIYLFLPEADNGIFFLVYRAAMFVPLFLGDWLRLSCLNIAGADKSTVRSLSANGFWFSIVLGGVLTAVSFQLASGFHDDVLGIPARYLPVVMIAGAAFIARNIWQSLLLVEHHMFSYGFTFVVWIVIFLILDFVFLGVLKYGIVSVLYSFVIATFATAFWTFGASYFLVGHSWRPSLGVFAESARIGLRAWVAVMGMFLLTSIHAFSIEPLAGAANGLVMVAMFSVGLRIQNILTRAADVAGSVLYSHVVQQDEKSGSRMTMIVTRNIMFVSVVFALCTAAAGRPLIILISSSRYIDALLPMLYMLPGIVAINAGSVLNTYYWGRAYPLDIVFAPYVATLAGALLNLKMIPSLGAEGAAISYSIMCVGWFVYVTIRFSVDTKLRIIDILVPDKVDFTRFAQKVFRALPLRRA